MKIEIPGIDTEKGLDLYDDDEELFIAVLRSYAENTLEVLDKIRSVQSGSLLEYVAYMHGIKGTSTNIGAEETRKEALELETMAKAGDLSGVLAKNGAFLQRTQELVNNIRTWLKQYDSN